MMAGEMKMQAGASILVASEVGQLGSKDTDGHGRGANGGDQAASWLKGTLDKIIHDQRPRVPGWALLAPHQSVGDYTAQDTYLLLVFDRRGRPHTHRFTPAEVDSLQGDSDQATARFRSLIESFCSDA